MVNKFIDNMDLTDWLILIFSVIFGSIIAELVTPSIMKFFKKNDRK